MEQVQQVRQDLGLAREAADAERQATGVRNTVSDCKLSEADLPGLLDLYNAVTNVDKCRLEGEELN